MTKNLNNPQAILEKAIGTKWDEWLASDDHLWNCAANDEGWVCCAESLELSNYDDPPYGARQDKLIQLVIGALFDHPDVVLSMLGIERFGTYLHPEHYGPDYDHFTQTTAPESPGVTTPLYRVKPIK